MVLTFAPFAGSSKKLNSASSLVAIGGDTMTSPSATRAMILIRFSRLTFLDIYALASALIVEKRSVFTSEQVSTMIPVSVRGSIHHPVLPPIIVPPFKLELP